MQLTTWTPTTGKSQIDKEEARKRVTVFSNGSYKYTPSDKYLSVYTKYKLKIK